MSDQPDRRSGRVDVTIAILIAMVALTTALSAWRTSNVGSAASDQVRAGLLDTLKRETTHTIDNKSAYDQADYATQAALERAAAEAMARSGRPALAQASTNVLQYLVEGLEKLGGPFVGQSKQQPPGVLDVQSEIAAELKADPAYTALDPEGEFADSTRYNDEKRWLTLISVVLAISLFWLGLAEVTRGRWRYVNVAVGTGIWVLCLVGLAAVEVMSAGARAVG